MERVAIVGSRSYPLMEAVASYVRRLSSDTMVVSGGAFGVDSVAEFMARKVGLQVVVFEADWKRYGKAAGMIRSRDVVALADRVMAFWDGKSPGTRGTIDLARLAGKPLVVYGPDGRSYDAPV